VFCDQLWVLAWDTYGRRPPTQHDLHRLVLGSSKASLPTHLKGLVLEHDFKSSRCRTTGRFQAIFVATLVRFPWARGKLRSGLLGILAFR
jgi:hypothetical protein